MKKFKIIFFLIFSIFLISCNNEELNKLRIENDELKQKVEILEQENNKLKEINWENVKTDKDYKSLSNRELVIKIIKKINSYYDEIKNKKISFTEVVKNIMNNNITSIVQTSKYSINTNHFIFGYHCDDFSEIDKNINKIPLIITESETETDPIIVGYNLRIYGKHTYFVNMKTGEIIDTYKLN